MAPRVGRVSAAWATGLSLLAALGFFGAASWTGQAPPTAVAGGTIWVFILSMIVAMPTVTAWIKRRSSDSRHSGGAA
ncbi:MAG: hypothetical protein HY359_04700 [Candidatus Rokubacteria bacterium]|nr:hypothetical protein [Candidatus Rokubacteria bacterium]